MSSQSLAGLRLKTNNETICSCLISLRDKRRELQDLIAQQETERKILEAQLDGFMYKQEMMAKSLAQRLAARDKYDQTIREAEENYQRIVECSGILLNSVQKEYGVLSEAIDKRVGTDAEDFKAFDNIEINFQNLNDYRIIEPSSSKYNRQRIMVKPVATVDSSTQFEDIKGESAGEDAESVSSSQTEEEMSQTHPPLQPRTQEKVKSELSATSIDTELKSIRSKASQRAYLDSKVQLLSSGSNPQLESKHVELSLEPEQSVLFPPGPEPVKKTSPKQRKLMCCYIKEV